MTVKLSYSVLVMYGICTDFQSFCLKYLVWHFIFVVIIHIIPWNLENQILYQAIDLKQYEFEKMILLRILFCFTTLSEVYCTTKKATTVLEFVVLIWRSTLEYTTNCDKIDKDYDDKTIEVESSHFYAGYYDILWNRITLRSNKCGLHTISYLFFPCRRNKEQRQATKLGEPRIVVVIDWMDQETIMDMLSMLLL